MNTRSGCASAASSASIRLLPSPSAPDIATQPPVRRAPHLASAAWSSANSFAAADQHRPKLKGIPHTARQVPPEDSRGDPHPPRRRPLHHGARAHCARSDPLRSVDSRRLRRLDDRRLLRLGRGGARRGRALQRERRRHRGPVRGLGHALRRTRRRTRASTRTRRAAIAAGTPRPARWPRRCCATSSRTSTSSGRRWPAAGRRSSRPAKFGGNPLPNKGGILTPYDGAEKMIKRRISADQARPGRLSAADHAGQQRVLRPHRRAADEPRRQRRRLRAS